MRERFPGQKLGFPSWHSAFACGVQKRGSSPSGEPLAAVKPEISNGCLVAFLAGPFCADVVASSVLREIWLILFFPVRRWRRTRTERAGRNIKRDVRDANRYYKRRRGNDNVLFIFFFHPHFFFFFFFNSLFITVNNYRVRNLNGRSKS